MRLILEFHNKELRGAVWIHYGNIETEVFDGNITIALEVYEHMKRYAMERSGLPDYQYFEDSSKPCCDFLKAGRLRDGTDKKIRKQKDGFDLFHTIP